MFLVIMMQGSSGVNKTKFVTANEQLFLKNDYGLIYATCNLREGICE